MTDLAIPGQSALYTLEAEEAVLGCVLINPECLSEARAIIQYPEAFYIHKHRWIWESFIALEKSGSAIDFITIANYLDEHKQLKEVGGVAYLTHLINGIATSLHVESYASIVASDRTRRALMEAATAIAKLAYEEGRPIADIVDSAQAALLAVSAQTQDNTESLPIKEGVIDLYDEIKERAENPREIFGLSTGLKDVDHVLGGLQAGETLLVSGAPGQGKSLLADQFAFSIAHEQAVSGGRGCIYSFEMMTKQVLRRKLSAMTGISTRPMRTGKIQDADWPLIVQGMNEMSDSFGLFIADLKTMPHPTTASLYADLKRKKVEYGINFFVLDYIEKLKDSHNGPDWERTAKLSDRLREICQKLDLHGVIIQRGNKTGMGAGVMRASHVGGSGQLIYDADSVVILNPFTPKDDTEKNSIPKDQQQNMVTLIFDKIREDETGIRSVHLLKRPGIPAFADYAPDPLSVVNYWS